jgi:hypothetical protein
LTRRNVVPCIAISRQLYTLHILLVLTRVYSHSGVQVLPHRTHTRPRAVTTYGNTTGRSNRPILVTYVHVTRNAREPRTHARTARPSKVKTPSKAGHPRRVSCAVYRPLHRCNVTGSSSSMSSGAARTWWRSNYGCDRIHFPSVPCAVESCSQSDLNLLSISIRAALNPEPSEIESCSQS